MNRFESHRIKPFARSLEPRTVASLVATERARRHEVQAPDPLAERQALASHCRSHVDPATGMVPLISSGMDCDGNAWRGRVHWVKAHPLALEQWAESFHQCAEGPQSFRLATLEQARTERHERQDLATRAHEDGHPHTLSATW